MRINETPTTARVIETQTERTDLPLVVMPTVIPTMLEPLTACLPMLRDLARVRLHTDFTLDEDTVVERMQEADAMIVIGLHIGDRLLDLLADHVRCFAFGGTGVASYINLGRTRELGIRVCNVVHYGNHAVAEHAFGLIMELTKHVGRLDREMREGQWAGMDGLDLYDQTIGLAGFGGIGQTMARIARGFGMHILVWNSHLHADQAARFDAQTVDDLGDLFERSDVVSLHLPLTQATAGIVTARQLDRLRPGSIIINTARAEVIAPGALLTRLQRGDILAGLDVFDREPLPADDPLRTVPGLVMTPHVAWRTDGANRNLSKQLMQSLAAFYRGERMNVVA
ncbi:MAG: D-2-hydroxyacid dehydrogenase family protein [Bifidobacterium mongoliense]